MRDVLFGELLLFGEQQNMFSDMMVDAEAENLFVGFNEPVEPVSYDEDEVEYEGGEAADEAEDSLIESGDGVTVEVVEEWERDVVYATEGRAWKEHSAGVMLQSSCFAVEWRGSTLLDKGVFIRGLLRAVGGDAAFVVGCEIRKSRADYAAVVRMKDRVRWRGWRRKLMFGHAADEEAEELFMKLRVPLNKRDDGINAFMEQMKRRCEVLEDRCYYNRDNLVRVQDKGYARPGRRKNGIVRSDRY